MTALEQETVDALVDSVFEVDLDLLEPHPGNRRAVGDIAGLTASVKELGVLEPMGLVPRTDQPGRFWVWSGQRRLAAARAAKRKSAPGYLRKASREDLLRIGAVNLQRENLTDAEEAEHYQQLEAEGFDVAVIARATGQDKARVVAGLKVARSEAAKAAFEKAPQLTIDHALVIDEFAGDPAAVKRLTNAVVNDPDQFDHIAAKVRQDAELQRTVDAKRAELTKGGVKIHDGGVGYNPSQPNCSLYYIGDKGGKRFTEETHRKCPGHAAKVTDRGDVEYVCLDPAGNDHRRVGGGVLAGQNPTAGDAKATATAAAEAEKQRAEQEARVKRQAEWEAATTVRKDFLRKLLSRRTGVKGLLRATATLMAEELYIGDFYGEEAEEFGLDKFDELIKNATDVQLPTVLFVAAGYVLENEALHNINQLITGSWQRGRDMATTYLQALEAAGYNLSPVEQLLVPKPRKKAATKKATPKKTPAKKTAPAKKAAAPRKAPAK